MPRQRKHGFPVQSWLPLEWEEHYDAHLEQKGLVTNSYIKGLVAQDLGLSDIPCLQAPVSEELFEDFHAAAMILHMEPEDLLSAIIQFHLENDQTLLNRAHFDHVYNYPHAYVPLKKST